MMKTHSSSQAVVWQMVVECTVKGAKPEEEMQAGLRRVALAMHPLCLPEARVTQLQAALAEAATNAMAHAAGSPCDLAISMRVWAPSLECLAADLGDGKLECPPSHATHQPGSLLRGWGFFLVEKTAGACGIGDPVHHMIDLFLYVEGD